MEKHYKLSSKDIWELRKNKRIYSTKHRKRHRLVSGFYSPIGFFVIFLGYLWTIGVPFYTVLYNSVIFAFFWAIIIYPIFSEVLIYRRIDNGEIADQKLYFDEKGISITKRGMTHFYDWETFNRIVEGASHYFLYKKDSKAIVLPKRIFNKDSIRALQQQIREKAQTYILQKNTSIYKISIKIRIVLLIICVVVYGLLQWYEEKQVVVDTKEDVYDLYIGIENNTHPDQVLNSELTLKENITREEVKKLEDHISYLQSKENDKEKRTYLYALGDLVHKAEFHINYRNLTEEQTTKVFGGESEHWRVQDYTIRIKPEILETLAGKIVMKREEMKEAKYFRLEVHMVVDEEQNLLLHGKEVKMDNNPKEHINLNDQSTGGYSQRSYRFVSENESPRKGLDKITGVYMIVQWQIKGEEEIKEEKITLIKQ